MADFKTSLALLLTQEGVNSSNPCDSGGETVRVAPAWPDPHPQTTNRLCERAPGHRSLAPGPSFPEQLTQECEREPGAQPRGKSHYCIRLPNLSMEGHNNRARAFGYETRRLF
jgi:hypothetical protein